MESVTVTDRAGRSFVLSPGLIFEAGNTDGSRQRLLHDNGASLYWGAGREDKNSVKRKQILNPVLNPKIFLNPVLNPKKMTLKAKVKS